MWSICEDEVHIWTMRLTHAIDAGIESRVLSAEEILRLQGYRSARSAQIFAACRSALRTMLGSYLGVDAAAVRIAYGRHGKPQLSSEATQPALQFNIAHCDSLAVFAFTRGGEIGVDVERIRPLPDLEQLTSEVMTPMERAAVSSAPECDRILSFWRCWTEKEAVAKATGIGLGISLTSLQGAGTARAATRLFLLGGDGGCQQLWRCHDFSPAGHVAMVAVARDNMHILVRTFDPAQHTVTAQEI